MHPKNNFDFFKKQMCICAKSKLEDDNPRQFDQFRYRSVNVKNAKV